MNANGVTNSNHLVLELRLALTSSEYDRLVDFFCTGIGIEPSQLWNNGGGRAAILEMGQGTLELFDDAQSETIDRIEVGHRVSGPVRLALQVPDLDKAVQGLTAHGGILVHPPILTPWGDRNARIQSPDGLQITLFQKSGK
jgi:predicted enzyme related to lactoylglutathione lyase